MLGFKSPDLLLKRLANRLGRVTDEMPNLKGYVQRIEARPAFQTAINA